MRRDYGGGDDEDEDDDDGEGGGGGADDGCRGGGGFNGYREKTCKPRKQVKLATNADGSNGELTGAESSVHDTPRGVIHTTYIPFVSTRKGEGAGPPQKLSKNARRCARDKQKLMEEVQKEMDAKFDKRVADALAAKETGDETMGGIVIKSRTTRRRHTRQRPTLIVAPLGSEPTGSTLDAGLSRYLTNWK
ncbi:MAG: hypothetical protein Q9181_005846 [Wetmoreana brouardii]